MADFLTLTNEDRAAARDAVLRVLRNGEVAVLASESGYVYIADAFNIPAVERIHAIRRSDHGTACQVFVASSNTATGVARNFNEDAQLLAEKFWPGPLTLLLTPQQGLNWDLGDGGALDEFALRIPSREFLREVLSESGPVATASAAVAGRPPIMDINYVPALPSDVGIYIDEGVLLATEPSTVLRISGLEVVREGAISRAELSQLIPSISS